MQHLGGALVLSGKIELNHGFKICPINRRLECGCKIIEVDNNRKGYETKYAYILCNFVLVVIHVLGPLFFFFKQ